MLEVQGTREVELAIGGENLIDHVTRDGVVTAKAGGSPYNVALALGRQGARVKYVSPISNDKWGQLLAKTLRASGVTLTGGRRLNPTTMARVTIIDGSPTYQFERDQTAERCVTGDTLWDSIGRAAGIHTGSLTLTDGTDAEVWERVMRQAYCAGRFTSLDPNVRMSVVKNPQSYRDRILRIMTHIHLLKLSDEDLHALFPDLSEAEALSQLLDKCTAQLIIVTRGPAQITAWAKGQKITLDASPLPNRVDTVGAGDTFMATVLARLSETGRLSAKALSDLTSQDLSALLARASMAAALNCTREGCDPPSYDDLACSMGYQDHHAFVSRHG